MGKNYPRPKFKPGDRVVLTALGIKCGLHGKCPLPCYGTVTTAYKITVPYVHIRRDGIKKSDLYHDSFWEKRND